MMLAKGIPRLIYSHFANYLWSVWLQRKNHACKNDTNSTRL